jgi:flagellar basal body-associated protein FliL
LKKIITIMIIAALVLAAFSIMSTQSVRADDTSQVRVLTYSFYTAPSNATALAAGDLIVVGELENVGSSVIGNVTLQCIAFGSSEQQLATTTTNAFVYYTLPGQKAPFYFDFSAASSSTNDLSWVSSVSSVAITVTSVTDTNQTQYSDLTIPASSPYLPGNGSYYVIGTIVNNGTQTVSDPWVVTTFYNSAGTVIALNFTDELTSSLAPGNAWRFFASPADDTTILTGEIANYTLTVDSLTLSNSTYTPPPTSPTPKGTSSPTKPSTLPIVVVVVVIVVLVVVVAALMLIRKRQKASQAPQTAPTPETTQPPPPPPPPPTT